jgi:hypothetical protein
MNYQINNKTIDINIYKPVYDSFCYIREKYVDLAIKDHKMLKIKIPQGEFLCDPKEWKLTGKRHEQVFLKPEDPMVLWGNHVIKKKSIEDTVQERLF